jgi:trimethylamine:corrinoid methyltransferase-like protein
MLFLFTGCFSFSQDKVHSIDLDQITEVTAFVQSSDLTIKEVSFDEIDDVKKIRDFLRKTEFRYATGSDVTDIGDESDWKVKLTFKGQRDQMYFFKKHAFIGKSTFLIKDGTTENLLKIMNKE